MNSPFAHLIDRDPPHLSSQDDEFFLRALHNAQFAMGSTYPNPGVGAVIVKDGRLIDEGFTQPPPGMHSECHAITRAGDCRGATLYVTLEPCCHFGKTPPCTDAIISAGIARVVYGVIDPNPKVSGQGQKILRDAGIDVDEIKNISLRDRAHALIKPFVTHLHQYRPFVVVKIATSRNGMMARAPNTRTKITGHDADMLVHKLRRATGLVMVGGATVRIDNPQLTARLDRDHHGRQPARVVVSAHPWALDKSLAVFDGSTETIIATSDKKFHGDNVMHCRGENEVDLSDTLVKLAAKGFTAVLVEPGPQLLESILQQQPDEIWWFTSPHEIEGVPMGDENKKLIKKYQIAKRHMIDQDELVVYVDQRASDTKFP